MREEPTLPLTKPKSVAVVIPARNEADLIGRALQSLLAQDYLGAMHIFVVDDHSSDGTADIARKAGDRVSVVSARALPEGWAGKVWAMSEGLDHALQTGADFILLTDADIVHASDSVGRLVAQADSGGYDMASIMVMLHCKSFAERALIPAFVFFFFLLYPPRWIAKRNARTAGAAGGCILIRPEALERIGGMLAICGELIDDCSLAREVKRTGGRVWLGVSKSTVSIREYRTFSEMERMISRTAFTQLGYSPLLLIGTVIGLAITYLFPPALTLWHFQPAALAAWVIMTALYLPAVRFYGLSPLCAPLLPLVSIFYAAATVHSAIRHWLGRGGTWKGRVRPGGEKAVRR